MGLTAWDITFGTYGARLHGDPRLTVDRIHNEFNGPYVEPSAPRHALATHRLAMAPPALHPQAPSVEFPPTQKTAPERNSDG